MKLIRATMIAVAAACFAVSAQAEDSAPPTNYQEKAVDYIESRSENAHSVRVAFQGQPYPIKADIGRHNNVDAWAVDVRVRYQMDRGATGRQHYTVVFVDGRPVALDQDEVKITSL